MVWQITLPSNLRDGAKASNPDIQLEYLIFLARPEHIKLSQKPHFGAIQSRSPNDTTATVPTPPSQSAINHNRRWPSGRVLGGVEIRALSVLIESEPGSNLLF
jgi:hypothetical protein